MPTLFVIAGCNGAGKTTLADALAPLVSEQGRPAIRASVDDFHHPRAVRYARGRHSPDGYYLDSYDYAAFTLSTEQGLFISYATGHLPFDDGDQNYLELGFKTQL